jgi:hypothetical protein
MSSVILIGSTILLNSKILAGLLRNESMIGEWTQIVQMYEVCPYEEVGEQNQARCIYQNASCVKWQKHSWFCSRVRVRKLISLYRIFLSGMNVFFSKLLFMLL